MEKNDFGPWVIRCHVC